MDTRSELKSIESDLNNITPCQSTGGVINCLKRLVEAMDQLCAQIERQNERNLEISKGDDW